jgi:hypothetical protein
MFLLQPHQKAYDLILLLILFIGMFILTMTAFLPHQ